MSRYSDSHHAPPKVIRFYQHTVDDLVNNTLTHDFFEFLKKAMQEGYELVFVSYSEDDDNETTIQSENHLRNYLNRVQGVRML